MDRSNLKNIEKSLKSLFDQKGEDAVPEIVDTLISSGLNSGATDIHLECFREYILVKFRLDGKLHQVATLPKNYQENIIARLKILSKLASFKTREPQDGRIEFASKDGEPIVLRSSFLPTLYGEKVVIRIPDPSYLKFEIDTLGLPTELQDKLIPLIQSLQGTLLLTGPSSSGKTTTIYAILKYLHKHFSGQINIMTIEDPIEASLDGVNQTQLDIAGGLDYPEALKAMLRQDPNVLVVGEIRDIRTARICIEAGLTGHLVISTIHSGEAVGVVTRLLNMGIEPFLIASSLSGVIAQRLVRIVCRNCLTHRPATAQEKHLLGLPEDEPLTVSEGKGCPKCNYSGFSGRTGIFEMLLLDEGFRELILSKATTEQLRQYAVTRGMRTLRDYALAKIREGITSPSEVLYLFITH